jgi:D-alanyl-D-alanine carboxypeptidase (penicillin-binding protein 5/6)
VGRYQFDNQTQDFLTTVPGALLAKTGYTDAAQHTYLAAARRNGHTLGVILLRDQRLPLDQYQQAAALFNWGFALRPAVHPVGSLAGPVGAASTSPPSPVLNPRQVDAYALPREVGVTTSTGRWMVLAPISAAVAGGLWLGCVAIAGRRAIQRRALRLR